MKLAYLIVTHFNPKQTLRLYNKLNNKDTHFVFHISKTCEPQYYETLYSSLKDQPNCYFAKRADVRWAEFSLVQAVINAIDTLVESKIDFDYASLLSGQDYPIKSNKTITEFLKKNKGNQYLEHIPFSEINEISHWVENYHFWIGKRRFWYPYETTNNLFTKIYNSILSLFLPTKRTVPYGYIAYKGSFWWTLTRDCVEFIHQQIHSTTGKELIKFFKHMWHPTESFIHTILMNSDYSEQIINNDLRFILWPDDSGHPKILTKQDFKEIVASDRLFGRKFDGRLDSTILDLVDNNIAIS